MDQISGLQNREGFAVGGGSCAVGVVASLVAQDKRIGKILLINRVGIGIGQDRLLLVWAGCSVGKGVSGTLFSISCEREVGKIAPKGVPHAIGNPSHTR